MAPDEVSRMGGKEAWQERAQGEYERKDDAVDDGVGEQHAVIRSLVGRWRVARGVCLSE